MNVLKVRTLLNQRYSSHFLDFVDKISNPIFGKPCSYSNTVMRAPLREKIQNAINRAINDCHPYNDYNNNNGIDGALIVGGRRRSRKKKNKKNGQKKKKSPSLESIKTKLSPSGVRKGGKGQDNVPLIDTDDGGELAYGTDELSYGTDNTTDSGPEFEYEDIGLKTMADEEPPADAAPAEEAPAEEAPAEEAPAEEASGEAAAEAPAEEAAATEEGKGAPSTETAAAVKSENSPLISKDAKEGGDEESKLKDGAPGMLCCTIL